MKGLVVRTDSIGDLILTAPVAEVLRRAYPGIKVSFLVARPCADILTLNPAIDEVLTSDAIGWRELARRRFDLAVILRPTPANAWNVFAARIPLRVGTAYRAYSILFNRRVRIHRKNVKTSELALNCETVRRGLGIDATTDPTLYPIYLGDDDRAQLAAFLGRYGIAPGGYVVLHPFGRGSAFYWPEENFLALSIELWHHCRMKTIIIGGPDDHARAEAFVERSDGAAVSAAGAFTLKASAGLIGSSAFFAGNSSGPIHIAAAMGAYAVGFYPPLRATNPDRWGPVTDRKLIFTPPGMDCRRCRTDCPSYGGCMSSITVSSVMTALEKKGVIRC